MENTQSIIEDLIKEREELRKLGKFKEADEIREIVGDKIKLTDWPDGTTTFRYL